MTLPFDAPSFAGAIKEWYEYWRKFRGQKIRIVLKTMMGSSSKFGNDPAQLVLWREILEGTIDAVQKYPPGFILKDPEQFIRYERNIAFIKSNSWEQESTDSDKRIKSLIKFVSFNIIETIEFV